MQQSVRMQLRYATEVQNPRYTPNADAGTRRRWCSIDKELCGPPRNCRSPRTNLPEERRGDTMLMWVISRGISCRHLSPLVDINYSTEIACACAVWWGDLPKLCVFKERRVKRFCLWNPLCAGQLSWEFSQKWAPPRGVWWSLTSN